MISEIQVKVGVLIEKEGKVLLIREWSNKRDGYFWNIVKGTLDNPKEGILECARRECIEEARAEVSMKNLISVFYSKNPRRVQFNFLADFIQGTPVMSKNEQAKQGEKIITRQWMSKEDATALKPKEFINPRSYSVIESWLRGIYAAKDLFEEFAD